jgi:predicted DNA-binding ribbon-helix-helix protein
MIRKRSVTIAGHPTSISLEDAFWDALGEIAAQRGISISELVSETDTSPRAGGLSSALRLLVLEHYRTGPKDRSG